MSLPQDRRPRGGRHQVGRHDAARRQDGVGRPRSPRHRGVHRLEGGRGAEGRRAGRRLAARQPAPQRHHAGLPRRRRRGARSIRSKNPALRRAIVAARQAATARRTTSSGSSSSPARAIATSNSRPSTPIGSRRPTSPSRARTPTTRCASPTTSCARSSATGEWALTERTTGKVAKTVNARALWDSIAEAAWHSRRSRRAVRHHHQRLAHLPASRAASTPRTRARSTCSSTTRPAIWPR